MSAAGTINSSSNPLHWTRLKGVPAGFADGVDANSGGDITGVAPGSGLLCGGAAGALTLAVDFGTGAGQVAEGNSVYTKAQADARYDTPMCKLAAANPYSYSAPWCDRKYATSVDTANDVGMFSDIAIGIDGLPIISHHDDTNQDLRVTHCGNATCTSGNTSTSLDTALNGGYSTSITIGADGLPIISYFDSLGGNLQVIHCGNAACTSGNTSTSPDFTGSVGSYSSIAIGADALPVISYLDTTNGDLRVTHCGNATCTSGNTSTSIDTENNVGWYTSIAIGADGLPIISHHGFVGGDLRITHCDDATCTTNTTTTVDTGNDIGLYTSVAIGTDGLPVISHQDSTDGDLLVTKCGNVACTSGNTTTPVDTDNTVGLHSSITIGADGLPIVSHHQFGSYDLRVTRCGNAACTSGNTSSSLETANKVGLYSSITIGADGIPIISHYDETTFDLRIFRGNP